MKVSIKQHPHHRNIHQLGSARPGIRSRNPVPRSGEIHQGKKQIERLSERSPCPFGPRSNQCLCRLHRLSPVHNRAVVRLHLRPADMGNPAFGRSKGACFPAGLGVVRLAFSSAPGARETGEKAGHPRSVDLWRLHFFLCRGQCIHDFSPQLYASAVLI